MQNTSKKNLWAVFLFFISLSFWINTGILLAAAKGTNERVQDIVKQFVGQTNQKFIGLGSWITGQNYKDPLLGGTSDHDIKFIVPVGTSNDEALAAYKNARKTLTDRIRNEFGSDADKVLQSVNLYPPTQLHRTISNKEAAKNTFKNWGVVPNLGVAEGTLLTDDILEKTTKEGLFGKGSSTFIQWDEIKRGRVFYKDSKTGQVYASIPDLEQMEAGWDLFTLEGQINNTSSWADNAATALTSKNSKDLKKYIDRVQKEMKKAKSIAGLKGLDDDLAQKILETIEKEGDAFFNNPQNVQMTEDLLKNYKGELEVLKKIEKSVDSKEIKIFAEMMDDQEFMNKVKRFFKSDAFQYGLDGIFYALMAVDAYNLYKQDGNLGLARAIARNATLTGILTDAGLEAVTEGILDSAAKVDCADVAEGIFTTYGYANVGEKLDLKKFAGQSPEYADMPDDKVGALVQESEKVFSSTIQPEIEKYLKSNLSKGSSPTPLDSRLAEKVIGKCLPYFKDEINKIKKETITSKKDLLGKFGEGIKNISITGFRSDPEKPRAGSKVTLEMKFSQSVEKFIQDSEDSLKNQGAINPSLFITYGWKITGIDSQEGSAPQEEYSAANLITFPLEKAATYKLQAIVTIKSVGDIFSRWGKIEETISKDFSLKVFPKEVEVPDLAGLDEEAAQTKIKELGLDLEKETAKSFIKGKDPEKIFEQNPKAKTKVDAGSKVKALFNLPKNLTKVSIITKTPLVLKPGETMDVSVEVTYSNGEKEKPKKEQITWKSSQPDVAVVDEQTGKIKGLSAGKTELTAQFQSLTAQVGVEVSDWERDLECTVFKTDWQGKQTASTVSNATVQVAGKKGTTALDGKLVLSKFSPGSYETLVEASGYKKPSPQSFTLAAAKDSNEAKTPFKLILYLQEERNPEELKVNPYQFNVTETGERRQLTAKITYSNGDEEEVTGKVIWESNNPQAAQVSRTGEVTIPNSANNGDQCIIKATYTFQGVTKTGTSTISVVLQSEVDFSFSPLPPRTGEMTTFSVNLGGSKNVRSTDTFRWKLRKFGEAGQQDMGSGATVSYTFPEQTRYAVEVLVLTNKGEEKARKEKEVTPEPVLKAISGTANEWRGKPSGKNLVVTSHPWNGQTRQFDPNPDFSRSFSNVQIYDLQTGKIKGAFNPGYLAYLSAGCVRYFIKGSSVKSVQPGSQPLPPDLEFDQSIAKSCNDVAPSPHLRIAEIREYGFVISWYDKKGGLCSATVKLYTGELEGMVFCQGGKDLVVPNLLLSPPSSIDEDTEARISVTNTSANPGGNYTWFVDGKTLPGSDIFSGNFSAGAHTIKVAVENSFGSKKESYPLSFTVAQSKKVPPSSQTPVAPGSTPTGSPLSTSKTPVPPTSPQQPGSSPSISQPGNQPQISGKPTVSPTLPATSKMDTPPSTPKPLTTGPDQPPVAQGVPTAPSSKPTLGFKKPYNPLDDPSVNQPGTASSMDLTKFQEKKDAFQKDQWSKWDIKTQPPSQSPQPISQEYLNPGQASNPSGTPPLPSTSSSGQTPQTPSPSGPIPPPTSEWTGKTSTPTGGTIPPSKSTGGSVPITSKTTGGTTIPPVTAGGTKPPVTSGALPTTKPPVGSTGTTKPPVTTASKGSVPKDAGAPKTTNLPPADADAIYRGNSQMTLRLWNASDEPLGATINIYLNKKIIKGNYVLVPTHQNISAKLEPGKNELIIEAVKAGKNGYCAGKVYFVGAESAKSEQVSDVYTKNGFTIALDKGQKIIKTVFCY